MEGYFLHHICLGAMRAIGCRRLFLPQRGSLGRDGSFDLTLGGWLEVSAFHIDIEPEVYKMARQNGRCRVVILL
jgi:hypothetical protein